MITRLGSKAMLEVQTQIKIRDGSFLRRSLTSLHLVELVLRLLDECLEFEPATACSVAASSGKAETSSPGRR
ncbi:hypothetical protein PsorP6_004544 [Peronosclerospora sorghi]|uniref:Uncharacterized protein n=1 Tax=Peronosclerospora sorghi TaxID=230839 RepID=A0ACC0VLS6_9STRA|nr:hypothetical protein PsorP6_004544 [Peronosclerospora sorghi]